LAISRAGSNFAVSMQDHFREAGKIVCLHVLTIKVSKFTLKKFWRIGGNLKYFLSKHSFCLILTILTKGIKFLQLLNDVRMALQKV